MNKSNKMSIHNYSLPIIPELETESDWEAFLGTEDDPVIRFQVRPWVDDNTDPLTLIGFLSRVKRDAPRYKDAFHLREQFFAIATPQDALAFFQEFGPMQLAKAWDRKADPVPFSSVVARRDYYLYALLEYSVDNIRRNYSGEELAEGLNNMYLWQNLEIELAFRQPMNAFVRCKDVESALRATVFLDRLRKMPWKRCARPDCGKPFEMKTRRAKLYCSPECSHLQAVRTYNKTKISDGKLAKKGKR